MSRTLLSHCCTWAAVAATLGVAATVLVPCQAAEPLTAKQLRRQRQQQRQGTGLPEAVTTAPPATIMAVAPLDRGSRPAVQRAAAEIDRLLAASWQERGVKASPRLHDAQFLRRIYLELGGRIPSYDEARRFLASKVRTRRADLIDDLLESPDYVSHFYNYWADVLRLQERPQKKLIFEPYLWYVKHAIATNLPYDTWVHAMLAADGGLWENPAVGFQLRDEGMPLPYVDNTVRVFLGTQIGCAQCHDHPFDDWTQHQFYELAAFLSGTRMRANSSGRVNAVGKVRPGDGESKLLMEARQRLDRPIAFVRFVQANTTAVSFHERPLKLPHDYQYEDAEPLSVVSPHVLWGEVPSAARDADRREQFASWLTAPDNRQFARTIANRMWKKVMGVGLVEPVDDFQPGNPPSHPELLEHLTDEMLRLDFNLREFVRIIASTDVYQRLAVEYDSTAAEPYRFTGPALKRMTAEQLWDSLLTLIAVNEWAYQRPSVAELAPGISVDVSAINYEQFAEAYKTYKQIKNDFRGRLNRTSYKGLQLVRASELPQPSPANHLMRQFGQGDRLAIETARQVATVPQILTLFNGWMTHAMLEQGSVIYDEVAKQKTMRGAVDTIFLAILTHKPTPQMRQLAEREIKQAETPAAGCGNLIWALLNTREFMFIE